MQWLVFDIYFEKCHSLERILRYMILHHAFSLDPKRMVEGLASVIVLFGSVS